MSNEDWSWRVGVLHGIGECCWQQKTGMIRRITKIIWQTQPIPAMAFVKHLVGGALLCAAEVSRGNSVVFEAMPDPELSARCDDCWSENQGGRILRPVGNMPMPKLSR